MKKCNMTQEFTKTITGEKENYIDLKKCIWLGGKETIVRGMNSIYYNENKLFV